MTVIVLQWESQFPRIILFTKMTKAGSKIRSERVKNVVLETDWTEDDPN